MSIEKQVNIRQLIRKGDPRLNISIPKIIKSVMADTAKLGRRQPQDEIIKRLAATIRNEEAYSALKNFVISQIK